ncbi:hypothetical protein [Delftia tsuruhatensis]|uniref:hypothetical protein n=1 Tax=Delftia tsuruhatensis TaxID=180282 RepID=UPI002028909D|nr:hypothetical protein [Delftia tsuruhatensis]
MSKTETQSEALRLAQGLMGGGNDFHEWLKPASAELRRLDAENKALRAQLEAPAVDASDSTLLDFLQETATAVEVLTQDEGEPPRFLVNRAISKDVRSAIRMARGKAIAAQAAAKTGDAA